MDADRPSSTNSAMVLGYRLFESSLFQQVHTAVVLFFGSSAPTRRP